MGSHATKNEKPQQQKAQEKPTAAAKNKNVKFNQYESDLPYQMMDDTEIFGNESIHESDGRNSRQRFSVSPMELPYKATSPYSVSQEPRANLKITSGLDNEDEGDFGDYSLDNTFKKK